MRERPILLVEDNGDEIELALHAFRRSAIAHPVVVKEDGLSAREFLFDTAEALPALVLLDLKLPKISGIEILRSIRANERTRLIPVIVLTTSREPKDILTSYAVGANSYIVKPTDFEIFVAAVRQIVAYWLSLNEQSPVEEHENANTTARAVR